MSVIGVAYALGAGVCWALYIIFGRRAGTAHGGQVTALGTAIGALMIVPIGYASSGAQLSVVVSNASNSVTSDSATLTVRKYVVSEPASPAWLAVR